MIVENILRIAIVAIWASLFSVCHSRAGVIFLDDFADGDAADGVPATWATNPYGGCLDETYDASGGDYNFRNRSPRPSGCMLAIVEDMAMGDTSLRTQLQQRTKLVGIQLRVNRADASGYVGLLNRDVGKLFIFRDEAGINPNGADLVLLNEVKLPFNPLILDTDVILQFDAVGPQLSLRAWPADEAMPSVPDITVSDATFAFGTVGLVSIPGGQGFGEVFFRYVLVADEPIPEPSSLGIAAAALAGLATVVLRPRHAAARSA